MKKSSWFFIALCAGLLAVGSAGQKQNNHPVFSENIRISANVKQDFLRQGGRSKDGSHDPRNVAALGPIQDWNTSLGGPGGDDFGYGTAADASGNVYVAGISRHSWGSPIRPYSGEDDLFVAKLDSRGILLWNTFLGGSGYDGGNGGIVLDASENIYIAGYSDNSWGLPIRPFSGSSDAFTAKLDGNGALVWNTFLGGLLSDKGYGIAVDSSGGIYVAGSSMGTWGSPVRPYAGGSQLDAFTAKIDGSGTLLWNTFLGGPGDDEGRGIAVNPSGNIYLAGNSNASWGSPINPHQPDPYAYAFFDDTFIARLDGNGAPVWNTFLGASSKDVLGGIAVDASGGIYVAGTSWGTWGLPVRPYSRGYVSNAYVARLDRGGALVWNTFLGGSPGDEGHGIAVGSNGSVYVAGSSWGTWGVPVRPHSGGFDDAFAAKLDDSGVLRWNTFLGGSGDDQGYGIAVDASGNVCVAGYTGIYPPTWGAYDAFLAKIIELPNTVISPNGGEHWWVGTVHNITWVTSPSVGQVKIDYSINNGSSWIEIIAATPNTGIFAWTIPSALSSQCWVRISDVAGGSITDTSDAAFSIISGSPPVISLNKTTLKFGAIAGGVSTTAQSALVSNTGGGTLDWTAISNQSWLTASPGSGTGGTVTRLRVEAIGLAAGTYQGKIAISDPNAVNSPQEIKVTLEVMAAGTSALPFGSFDTPIDGTTGITGAIPVTGWILDDIEATRVELERDPDASDPAGAVGPDNLVYIGDAIFVEGARPDVEAIYPQFPLSSRGGWGYMLLTNMLPNKGNGTYKLYAYVSDKEGHRVLLGTRTITCDNAHAVKPFGAIDSPAQGGTASGSLYINYGWALTPLPKTIPKDGSTISVWVDGVQAGSLNKSPNVYNQYRIDVSTAFPGLNNSNGPVGALYLDTTKYVNGVHTIHWVATDDQGAADGIGSRYFIIANAETAADVTNGNLSIGHREPLGAAIRSLGSSRASRGISSTLAAVEDILNLPISFDTIGVKRGFDPSAPAEVLMPDNFGSIHIEMREVERLEVDLGKGHGYRGCLMVGDELWPLPIGSTLDPQKGAFSWMPGPGFLGTFNLVFIKENEFGMSKRIPVQITIKPKFGLK